MWFKKRKDFENRISKLEDLLFKTRNLLYDVGKEFCGSNLHNEIRDQLSIDLSIGFQLKLRSAEDLFSSEEEELIKEGYKYYGQIAHLDFRMNWINATQRITAEVWARPSQKVIETPHFGPSPGDG